MLVPKDGADTWEWFECIPFCWSGRCALLGAAGGDSDLDLCRRYWSRGLGLISGAKGRGAGGEGRGGRGGGRTERVNTGALSCC